MSCIALFLFIGSAIVTVIFLNSCSFSSSPKILLTVFTSNFINLAISAADLPSFCIWSICDILPSSKDNLTSSAFRPFFCAANCMSKIFLMLPDSFSLEPLSSIFKPCCLAKEIMFAFSLSFLKPEM